MAESSILLPLTKMHKFHFALLLPNPLTKLIHAFTHSAAFIRNFG